MEENEQLKEALLQKTSEMENYVGSLFFKQ